MMYMSALCVITEGLLAVKAHPWGNGRIAKCRSMDVIGGTLIYFLRRRAKKSSANLNRRDRAGK